MHAGELEYSVYIAIMAALFECPTRGVLLPESNEAPNVIANVSKVQQGISGS